MSAPEKSLTERVSSSIARLSSAAQDLNTVSGELGQAITAIDVVLQNLKIGVATWTTIRRGDGLPDDTNHWSQDIGYAKVGSRWGIALRRVTGDYERPDEDDCDSWLFNDAPRRLRIEGVEKIPDLLEALIKNTEETTKKIRNKTAEANQLAAAIAQAAGKKPPTWTAMVADAVTNADVVPSPLAAMAAEAERKATADAVLNPLAAMVADSIRNADAVPATTLSEIAKKSARRGK